MGCCLSSGSKSSPPVSASHPTSKSGNRYDFEPPKFLKSTAETRAPPPDCDEETVKEVLSSETPNPKPPHRPPPPQQQQHYSAIPPSNSPPNPVNPQPEEPIVVQEKKEIRAPVVEEEEISEQDASEVCSVSVSFSMSESAMSTATTANDEEVTMKQMKGSRRSSPAGKMSSARMNRAFSAADSGPRKEQRVVGRSPTRRSDRSPVKRNYSGGGGAGQQVRMVHHQGPNPGARRPLRPDPSRRETGDSSAARRSRSPATTHRSAGAAGTGAGSRNGSVKRANQSPGRVRKDPPEISANSEATKSGNRDTAFHHHRGNDDDDDKEDAAAANESLENPLVSLECFIFL